MEVDLSGHNYILLIYMDLSPW